MQSIPDPRDSIITDASIQQEEPSEVVSSSASTMELDESNGTEEFRNKKKELSMAKVHQKNQFNKSSFNQKGNRYVPKKYGRRMR